MFADIFYLHPKKCWLRLLSKKYDFGTFTFDLLDIYVPVGLLYEEIFVKFNRKYFRQLI